MSEIETEVHDSVEVPARPPVATMEFRNARDVTLARTAFEHRADELKKLAKKNEDEGYLREGRVIAGDAGAITELLLPQLEGQGEIEFATEETLQHAIANVVRPIIRKATARKWEEDVLVRVLARQIADFTTATAARAYDGGRSVRDHDPAMFGIRSIDKLRLQSADLED